MTDDYRQRTVTLPVWQNDANETLADIRMVAVVVLCLMVWDFWQGFAISLVINLGSIFVAAFLGAWSSDRKTRKVQDEDPS